MLDHRPATACNPVHQQRPTAPTRPLAALVVGGGGPQLPEPPDGADTHAVSLDGGSVVQGYRRIVSSHSVWHYMGIPYAKPPLGDLRFRRPEPLDAPVGSAEKPFRAFVKPKSCYYWPLAPEPFERANKALIMWWNNTEMSEDCLHLNIWTPTTRPGDSLAVMVWIYGGSFFGGSSSLEVYDGAALAAKGGVIVASMQYRTGALGFLYLDDDESPGNMGLMDQLLAIKWIKANIRHFGGDSDRITLFGESAGAVSVSYHMLSPYSQNYFNRAIMNSGTAMAWWAGENRTNALGRATVLAENIGCHVDPGNLRRTVDCLRHVSMERIQQKSLSLLDFDNKMRQASYRNYWSKDNRHGQASPSPETFMYFDLIFKPVIGTYFIPHDPKTVLERGTFKKTDLLMGVMKDEGIFWILYALRSLFMHSNFTWHTPAHWNHPSSKSRAWPTSRKQIPEPEIDPFDLVARYFIHTNNINNQLVESIAFEYQIPSVRFGFNNWSSKDVLDAFDDLTSDRSFKCPTVEFANKYIEKLLRSQDNYQVWMYSFEHRTERLPLPDWTGAMHGFEMEYVFGMPFNDAFKRSFYSYTSVEEILSEDVIRFWSNFAKTGNPNQPGVRRNVKDSFMTWPPYKLYNKSHIVLDVKTGYNYRIGRDLRRRQCQFWQHIDKIRLELMKSGQSCSEETRASGNSGATPVYSWTVQVLMPCLMLLVRLA